MRCRGHILDIYSVTKTRLIWIVAVIPRPTDKKLKFKITFRRSPKLWKCAVKT